MVGANYMGGKRSSARAKSKDIIGRAQRRHFGKQRLASALYAIQENRNHPRVPTLSTSVLPEFTLAHARCDANTDSGATSSGKVFSGDQLYSSTSANNRTRGNKPSRVLGALDISDHMSMRAAIDRILQQPNLIGIGTPNHKDTAYSERMRTPGVVEQPTNAHINFREPDACLVKQAQISYSRLPRHKPTCPPENNPSTRCEPAERGILSSPDSPLRTRDVDVWDEFDSARCAELFTGTNPADGGSEWPCAPAAVIYSLPRSPPFPCSSRSSSSSILHLDTSPWVAVRPRRSDELFENVDCIDLSPLSARQTNFRRSSRVFPIRDGSTGVDERQFTETNSNEGPKARRSPTTCCTDGCNLRVLRSQDDAADEGPSHMLIDFLSDPHPWEAIDKILKLKPSSAMHSVVDFTRHREGVGYVSPRAACFETVTDEDALTPTLGPSIEADTRDWPCLFGDSDLGEEDEW